MPRHLLPPLPRIAAILFLGFFAGAVSPACQLPGWPLETGREYVVHDAAELLEALGSDRRIYLQPNLYDLSADWNEAAAAGKGPVYFDGTYGQVVLKDFRNLSLIGAGPGSTRLVIQEAFPHVLFFKGGENITIRGMELSHRPPSKAVCLGAALGLENVKNVRVEDMVLKGSGTFGVWLEDVENFTLSHSVITECTQGIVWASGSRDLRFSDSVFVNNAGGFNFENTGPVRLEDSRILFNRAVDTVDYSRSIFDLKKSLLIVKDTEVERNVARSLIESDRKKVRMEGVASKDNRWTGK